jgi:hypothetical protein
MEGTQENLRRPRTMELGHSVGKLEKNNNPQSHPQQYSVAYHNFHSGNKNEESKSAIVKSCHGRNT